VTVYIPTTGERVEVRLVEDDAGMLYLRPWASVGVTYSLGGVLGLGWEIVDSTADERALLEAHGFKLKP
jgi:hypothetical protein